MGNVEFEGDLISKNNSISTDASSRNDFGDGFRDKDPYEGNPNLIKDLKQRLTKFGYISQRKLNLYKKDGWKKYYPEDDNFFLWDKGEVEKDKHIIENKDNYDKGIIIYEGETKGEGNTRIRHGEGTETTKDYIRIGTWRENKFTGWGIEVGRENGDAYLGKFVDGVLNGKGKCIQINGSEYEGEFKNNKRNGKGTLKLSQLTYEGDFVDGAFKGIGKINFKEGVLYEGSFEGNCMTGNGKITYLNGDVYEGGLLDGERQGQGTYIYNQIQNNNIVRFEGNFDNGLKNGKGKYVTKNGETIEAEFVNGVMSKEIEFRDAKGNLLNKKNKSQNEIKIKESVLQEELEGTRDNINNEFKDSKQESLNKLNNNENNVSIKESKHSSKLNE